MEITINKTIEVQGYDYFDKDFVFEVKVSTEAFCNWIEEYLMERDVEVYFKWENHTVNFKDEENKKIIETFLKITNSIDKEDFVEELQSDLEYGERYLTDAIDLFRDYDGDTEEVYFDFEEYVLKEYKDNFDRAVYDYVNEVLDDYRGCDKVYLD